MLRRVCFRCWDTYIEDLIFMDPWIAVWFNRNNQQEAACNRIYYSKVYWRLNMFRVAYRSSSGALNCICSLWFIYPCGDRPLYRLGGNWVPEESCLCVSYWSVLRRKLIAITAHVISNTKNEWSLSMRIDIRLNFLKFNMKNAFNPLNPELNPICYLLALLAHHFLHVSRIRVKLLTFRRLMSYIYIYIYIWH